MSDLARIIDLLQVGEAFSTARCAAPRGTMETFHLRLEGYSFNEVSERPKERLSNTRHHYYRGLAALLGG